jgi:hypothetical protein
MAGDSVLLSYLYACRVPTIIKMVVLLSKFNKSTIQLNKIKKWQNIATKSFRLLLLPT